MDKVKYFIIFFFCLIFVREVSAEADTVRFYMQIDTTRNGIYAGQDVNLRYICTTAYDSVKPPHFETFVHVIKEAIPHRSGHAVKNGELTNIYEIGFDYFMRFEKEGSYDLPLSSVKVNGKEYATPPQYRLGLYSLLFSVHPASYGSADFSG